LQSNICHKGDFFFLSGRKNTYNPGLSFNPMHSAAAHAPEKPRVAVVTDNAAALRELRRFVFSAYETILTPIAGDMVNVLSQGSLDAIVFDLESFPDGAANGLSFLQGLRKVNQDLVLIAFTASTDRGIRIQAANAVDELFVAPVDFYELQIVLERTLTKRSIEVENRRLAEQVVGRYSFGELIGGSEAMRRVYDAILRVAQSNTSIAIRGQSGTGKELVARTIVAMGPRRDRSFISLNCAALPENLIESELFGHEKGAFTGAHISRPGHIELADGGTLFLDEIGTLSLALQTKLLRVLEERCVQRLGGKTTKKIDFRLMTATNENLEVLVQQGKFRDDLYYRIHVIPIYLPALRERRGDIALLADHFLRIYCAANRVAGKRLDLESLEVLEEYSWPGNVRELQNMMQRLALMVEGPVVKMEHLPQQLLYASTVRNESLLIPPDGIDFDNEMTRIEAAYVRAALHRTKGKKVAAASLLKVNVQKMKYLCKKHDLSSEKVKIQPIKD
jgi:DNA-binding NtrC family response regulator